MAFDAGAVTGTIDLDYSGAVKALTAVQQQTKTTMAAMKAHMEKLSPSLTQVGMGFAAVGAAGALFFRKAIMGALDEQAALVKLQASIAATGQQIDSARLVRLAEELMKVTPFTHEATEGMMGLLAAMGFNEKQIIALTPRVQNLAMIFGKDLEGTARMVGRTILTGTAGGLSRMGIVLDETAVKTKNFNVIMGELDKHSSGAATTIGKSLPAQMEITKNAVDELSEAIGANLLPLIADATKQIGALTQTVQGWTSRNQAASSALTVLSAKLTLIIAAFGAYLLLIPRLLTGGAALIAALGSPVGLIGVVLALTAAVWAGTAAWDAYANGIEAAARLRLLSPEAQASQYADAAAALTKLQSAQKRLNELQSGNLPILGIRGVPREALIASATRDLAKAQGEYNKTLKDASAIAKPMPTGGGGGAAAAGAQKDALLEAMTASLDLLKVQLDLAQASGNVAAAAALQAQYITKLATAYNLFKGSPNLARAQFALGSLQDIQAIADAETTAAEDRSKRDQEALDRSIADTQTRLDLAAQLGEATLEWEVQIGKVSREEYLAKLQRDREGIETWIAYVQQTGDATYGSQEAWEQKLLANRQKAFAIEGEIADRRLARNQAAAQMEQSGLLLALETQRSILAIQFPTLAVRKQLVAVTQEEIGALVGKLATTIAISRQEEAAAKAKDASLDVTGFQLARTEAYKETLAQILSIITETGLPLETQAELLAGVAETYGKIATQYLPQINLALERVRQQIAERGFWGAFAQQAREQLGQVGQAAKDLGTAVIGHFQNMISGMMKGTASFRSFFQNVLDSIFDFFAAWVTKIIVHWIAAMFKLNEASGKVNAPGGGGGGGGSMGSTLGAGIGYAVGGPIGGAIGGFVGGLFAEGGIVTKPTIAMVGEAGPEAIIPLDQLGAGGVGGRGSVVQNFNINADALDENNLRRLMRRSSRALDREFWRGGLRTPLGATG
jgi:hypothetical protein